MILRQGGGGGEGGRREKPETKKNAGEGRGEREGEGERDRDESNSYIPMCLTLICLTKLIRVHLKFSRQKSLLIRPPPPQNLPVPEIIDTIFAKTSPKR
jgi:hypothetical protein